MIRENELKLARILVNSVEHLTGSEADWKKVRDAFRRVCGDDRQMQRRAYQYMDLLEEIFK